MAVIVFVGGLGKFANQIDKVISGIEAIQQRLNFLIGRHAEVAHFQNVHLGNNFPQQHPADSRFIALAVHAQRNRVVQANSSGIVGGSNLFSVGEYFRAATVVGNKARHVVNAQNDILTRHNYRAAVGRGQDVVAGQHQHPGFYLSLHGQRNMHRHLITVKVRIKGGTDQRMQLQRLALNQDRFKCLNPQTMKGWSTIEHYRILFDDVVQSVPNFGNFAFDHFLGAFNR